MARGRIITPNDTAAALEVKHRLETAPAPLPRTRPRSLTNPKPSSLNPDQASKATYEPKNSHQDVKSGFFSLPLEVRQDIYELAIAAPTHDYRDRSRGVFQIINTKRGLRYVTCDWSGHFHHYSRCFNACHESTITPFIYDFPCEHHDWCGVSRTPPRPIALLQTCRQMFESPLR